MVAAPLISTLDEKTSNASNDESNIFLENVVDLCCSKAQPNEVTHRYLNGLKI
jgi:hypothetical protein